MTDRGKPGRRPDRPDKYLDSLLDVADIRAQRDALSVRAAAEWVERHYGPPIGWYRLAALYRPRSRELEIRKMGSLYGKLTWMYMEPDEWLALVERAEDLARRDPRVTELARKVPKRRISARRDWPFSLWRPAELVELLDRLEKSGIG